MAELQAMTPDMISAASSYGAYGALAESYGHHGVQLGSQGQNSGGQWNEDHLGAYYGLDPKECVNCGTTEIIKLIMPVQKITFSDKSPLVSY